MCVDYIIRLSIIGQQWFSFSLCPLLPPHNITVAVLQVWQIYLFSTARPKAAQSFYQLFLINWLRREPSGAISDVPTRRTNSEHSSSSRFEPSPARSPDPPDSHPLSSSAWASTIALQPALYEPCQPSCSSKLTYQTKREHTMSFLGMSCLIMIIPLLLRCLLGALIGVTRW